LPYAAQVKIEILAKMKLSVKNQNFGQKVKLWTQISIKYFNFGLIWKSHHVIHGMYKDNF